MNNDSNSSDSSDESNKNENHLIKSDQFHEQIYSKLLLSSFQIVNIDNNSTEKTTNFLQTQKLNLSKNSFFLNSQDTHFIKDEFTKIYLAPEQPKDSNLSINHVITYKIIVENTTLPEQFRKVTKCRRRYEHFRILYKKLTKKYPYILLPKLSSKKIALKIITNDYLLNQRKEELTYLLDYIYSKKELAILPECIMFMKTSFFNEAYFTKTEDNFSNEFSIFSQNKQINYIWKGLTDYFSKNKTLSNEQMYYIKKHQFYLKMYDNTHQMRHKLTEIYNTFLNSQTNIECFYKNLNFLKEYEQFKMNDLLEKVDTSTQELISIDIRTIKALNKLMKQVLGLDLLLKGVVDLIKRYLMFIEICSKVDNALVNSVNFPGVDLNELQKISLKKKEMFKDKMQNEIDNFIKNNEGLFEECVKKFVEIMKSVENAEKIILEKIVN
jgi:hypothetical protein